MASQSKESHPSLTGDVKAVIDTWPSPVKKRALELRALILQTAVELSRVGTLSETLKWGEPAWLTEASKTGSTIRIGWKQAEPETLAIYFNCKTTLVDGFRDRFPDTFVYDGTRAIKLKVSERLSREALGMCLGEALLYHVNKRQKTS